MANIFPDKDIALNKSAKTLLFSLCLIYCVVPDRDMKPTVAEGNLLSKTTCEVMENLLATVCYACH